MGYRRGSCDLAQRTDRVVSVKNAKPHVVICTDGVFPQAMGGMQRHTRLLAEYLAKSGEVSLTVIHPHAEQVFGTEFGINEVRIEPIDTQRNYLRELWRYSERVAKKLDALSADVILSQGFCVWKGMERFRSRLILHPHGLEMFQGIGTKERAMGRPFRWVVRYMARRSAYVVSLGGILTRILNGLVEGSSSTVVTVPNAVELPAETTPYEVHPGPLRLLFVGRFAFNKGLDLLIAVARRLEHEGKGDAFLFELAGDGPLLNAIRAEGLPPNVQLLGRVDDETLFKAYAECDAFILPTRFEGMPTVVLEAMARSRPIIVSDVGATAELVDGSNGYLLPKGDPEALYQAVIAFGALNADQRQAMALSSRQRVQERFTWSAVTAEFLSLFQLVDRSVAHRE